MMPECRWGRCKKVSEISIKLRLPHSKSLEWKNYGETIYLCEKHYRKLLKGLHVEEDD